MATQPANSSPASDFMADFYAEADDHLVQIRQGLLKLEEQLGQLGLDADGLQRLFRSFHSLKGICGMAGLNEAEQLSHRAEDFLRALSRQELVLTEEGLSCLGAVVQKLEENIIRHRESKPSSDIKPLVDRLASLLEGERPSGDTAEATAPTAPDYPPQVASKLQTARQQGLKILRAVFKPAPALDSRGINIASVRGQLQTIGEILHAAPNVQAGGELWFELLIAADSLPGDRERWASDGIEMTEFQPATPAAIPSSETPSAASPFIAPSHFVRVELSRLDDLMRIMGDLVVQRARLEEALGRVENQMGSANSRTLNEITHSFSRDLRHLRDGLMRVRLVPIAEVFDRLPFVVRDLSRETGKKVRLHLQGQQTELDKYLVERLKEPLLHLMRNAISHGIEEPAQRATLGKSAEGNITLRASAIGETVIIEVIDDGRGMDREWILERARANGFSAPDRLESSELLDVLCTPGFSTREEADLGAGRGIGMAVVRSTVLELGGELELESHPGCGTTFRLRLPLTLAVADAIIVSAGGQRFAMPQAAIQEITTAEETAINRLEQNEIVKYRNGVLPLIRLSDVFGLAGEQRNHFPVLVIGTGLNAVGILADRVLGHREVVVRPVNDPLLKVPGISGATELGDGHAVLILDSLSLTQTARSRRSAKQRDLMKAL